MIAIGAGGLDIATALSSGKYYFKTPQVVNIHLENKISRPLQLRI